MESSLSCWISLWTVFLLQNVSAEPKAPYVVRSEPLGFDRALEECSVGGTFLAELRTEREASDVRKLVSASLSGSRRGVAFWVGLRKANDRCVVPELPLRGFGWTESGDRRAERAVWRVEPPHTCTTTRCAALEGDFDGSEVRSWGFVSRPCKTRYPFICELRDRQAGEQESMQPLPEETETGSRTETTPEPEPEPETTPEPEPETTPEPEPGRCGGYIPNIPGARSLTPDPAGGSLRVECWSGLLLELRCSGSPALWRLNGSADAACVACGDGFERHASGTCVDVDECRRSAPCRRDCVNTEGSYLCVCYDRRGTRHAEGSEACLEGGDGDPSPNRSLASPPPPPPGPTDGGALSGVLIPALIAVMALVVLVVLVLAAVKCCMMRRSKKRAMRKAEKMAMRSKEAAGKDSMETTNEKEAT
ncbi:C-type lectin domain family 14 member A [Centroberyx affinis]|uniref:C-type lectin domain family 14 member A n=1 Tax=Centroberyx affinis TaxID=166261 RepID=UPI003A5BAF72